MRSLGSRISFRMLYIQGYLTSPTNDSGLANLEVFVSALVGSGLVTTLGSMILENFENSKNTQNEEE